MTRKITIIFIFFLSIKIYSQKCKTEQDPFTNEKITSFDFNNKTVYLEIKNDTIKFDITFNYWGERDYEFEEKTDISFKLENGSTIILTTIKKSEPKIENVTSSSGFYQGFGGIMATSNSKNFTAYSFVFLLTESELKKLADSKIELVRIPDTDEGEYIDLKAKGRTKKKIKAIIKGANCIIEQL